MKHKKTMLYSKNKLDNNFIIKENLNFEEKNEINKNLKNTQNSFNTNKNNENLLIKNLKEDFYVKNYLFSYILLKISFSICQTTFDLFWHNSINTHQSNKSYKNFSTVFFLTSINIASNIFFGYLSFFINPRKLITALILFFSFSVFLTNLESISSERKKLFYYGDLVDFLLNNSSITLKIFMSAGLSAACSLFEISLNAFPPTLYRGHVLSAVNSLVNFTPMISMVLFYLVDSWGVNLAILGFFGIVLFLVYFNEDDLEIVEFQDESYFSKRVFYLNRRKMRKYFERKN